MDLPEQEEYACALIDRNLIFYDSESLQKKTVVACYSPQTTLENVGRKKDYFISGDFEGLVHLWSIDKHCIIKTLGRSFVQNSSASSPGTVSPNLKPGGRSHSPKIKQGFSDFSQTDPELYAAQMQYANGNVMHHSDLVSKVIYVAENDTIASGSLDKSLIFWDPSIGIGKDKRSGIHSRGIIDMAYSPVHRILISVAGFLHAFLFFIFFLTYSSSLFQVKPNSLRGQGFLILFVFF